MRIKTKIVWLLILAIISYLKFFNSTELVPQVQRNIVNNIDTEGGELDVFLPGNKAKIQFAIAVCQPNLVRGKGYATHDRQFRQIKVLLKSAALLTSTTITYNIITDSHDVYLQIVNSTLDWPLKYRERIIFADRKDLYNPPDLGDMRNMYRPCSSQRLFLAFAFPDDDAMVYTDTDAYFMQPPENLWHHFSNFDDMQVAGVTAHLFQYSPPFNLFPVFGWTGLNSGVLLLNLTRIRSFPKGWISSIKEIMAKYKEKKPLHDQDILNILFSRDNEIYAYEVPCEWNYMFIMCNHRRNTCPGFANNGLALLHGVGGSFVKETGPKFKAIFFEWEKYDMRSPVEELIAKMENATKQAKAHACGKRTNIEKFIMKGIKETLLKKS